MYPSIDIEQLGRTRGEEATRNIVIQGVLDKIKSDHVGRDEFVERISGRATNIKAFIQQQGFIDLPEENLAIETMPAYFADGSWTRLTTPGAFEAGGPIRSSSTPFPRPGRPMQAASFMEEHNNFYLDFMTVQRVFPGSFVPTYFIRRDASIIKRWPPTRGSSRAGPIFLADIFMENGYNNYDLRMRLNQLKLLLKTVIDFQMDINVHEGTWTKERVVEYMTGRGFMTPAEADRRWRQIVLNPGAASLPYIGYQEILDMEKDARKLKGEAYNTKDFLQKLLSHGAIPLRTLKLKMAQ